MNRDQVANPRRIYVLRRWTAMQVNIFRCNRFKHIFQRLIHLCEICTDPKLRFRRMKLNEPRLNSMVLEPARWKVLTKNMIYLPRRRTWHTCQLLAVFSAPATKCRLPFRVRPFRWRFDKVGNPYAGSQLLILSLPTENRLSWTNSNLTKDHLFTSPGGQQCNTNMQQYK